MDHPPEARPSCWTPGEASGSCRSNAPRPRCPAWAAPGTAASRPARGTTGTRQWGEKDGWPTGNHGFSQVNPGFFPQICG